MDESGCKAFHTVHDAAHEVCVSNPLATIGEGTVRSSILRALLENGFKIIEGSAKNKGKILSLAEGKLDVQYTELPPMPAIGGTSRRWSPDFRITYPLSLTGEIQCRSVWGSQDALSSSNILNDLDRICSGLAQFFVFCSDLPLYRALLGDKMSPRGRKALATEKFATLFPNPDDLSSKIAYYKREHGDHAIIVGATITPTVWGMQRVVLTIAGDKYNSNVIRAVQPEAVPSTDGPVGSTVSACSA